jgi:hypothetical protein
LIETATRISVAVANLGCILVCFGAAKWRFRFRPGHFRFFDEMPKQPSLVLASGLE